jgi:hypothetical protein
LRKGNGESFTARNFSLYCLPTLVRVIKSRRLTWAGHLARLEECRNAFKILRGKFTGNRPFGRFRCRWENNIRTDLKKIELNTRNWTDFCSG